MFEEYVTPHRQLVKIRESMQEYKVYPVQIRRALSFDGVDDYVNVPSTPMLSGLNNITVMAWVCPSKTSEGIIVSKHSAVTGREWMLYINPNNYRFTFQVYDQQAGTFREVFGSLVQIGVPVFLAGTYDGSVLRIYENAVLKSQATTNIVIRPLSTPIRVGSRANDIRFYGGIIDEVRIYNRALTADEIKWLYNNGRGRPGQVGIRDGCVLCLDFSRWRGSSWVKDISGYGNHGQIYGARRVPRGF
ncbi:MAG: LamG domain-containing protein [Candidatus Bathyarchaeia archaeon]